MHDESVYVGLGSNLGNRTEHLRAGLEGLGAGGLRLRAVSSFYLTEPDLPPEHDEGSHPWYVNCVAALEGASDPGSLLDLCQALERQRGRPRPGPAPASPGPPAPRTLDIDVLLFGDRIVDTPELRVPHPRMHRRRFVLVPLTEIAADARHPGCRCAAAELLASLPADGRVWLLARPPGELG